ncbi:hypothetical protein OHA40_16250 [Nocardia sp. NBC_00508]|uniref:hypothetical protein n=1 Tax=Nocardia sp. NBC_00508 TaxID=2975992 RepID=UPI002E81DF62|nr:hypothetical protein [Nocardia sp. NBC_00508]WUD69535.1 hypothetical protein OHA40_16250 [Nocardia sp. NBC_00508]
MIGLALIGAGALTGCDSVAGIPDESAAPAAARTTPPAAVPATTPPTSSSLPPVPADAPPVGAVAGLPAAASAVQRWAADLQSHTIAEMQEKCWTIAPKNVADMYDDQQSVLAALAQPGTATEDTVIWQSRTTTVAIDRAEVETGYACPRVAEAGADVAYNDADARHTVRRYLSRFVGSPLDPADQEGTYPLVCKASPATWDPTATGRAIPAPLANNQGMLTGTTAFADQQIRSEQLNADYVAVLVPVTNSSGVAQTRTFTLRSGPDGYCIGEVSA